MIVDTIGGMHGGCRGPAVLEPGREARQPELPTWRARHKTPQIRHRNARYLPLGFQPKGDDMKFIKWLWRILFGTTWRVLGTLLATASLISLIQRWTGVEIIPVIAREALSIYRQMMGRLKDLVFDSWTPLELPWGLVFEMPVWGMDVLAIWTLSIAGLAKLSDGILNFGLYYGRRRYILVVLTAPISLLYYLGMQLSVAGMWLRLVFFKALPKRISSIIRHVGDPKFIKSSDRVQRATTPPTLSYAERRSRAGGRPDGSFWCPRCG